MTEDQLRVALAQQLIAHPYLHAAVVYVLLYLAGMTQGIVFGIVIEHWLRGLTSRCLDWMEVNWFKVAKGTYKR